MLSPHRPELQRSCKRKFASSRLLRSACFRYVPTLAWPRISGYCRLAHRSFRSVISRLPPRHEVKVKQVLWNKSSAFISGADNPHERFLITSHPHMSWQVPYPVSSRGRSIQLSPQLRREQHIVMPLHWYPKVRNAKCSWQQKIFEIIFLHRKIHPTVKSRVALHLWCQIYKLEFIRQTE